MPLLRTIRSSINRTKKTSAKSLPSDCLKHHTNLHSCPLVKGQSAVAPGYTRNAWLATAKAASTYKHTTASALSLSGTPLVTGEIHEQSVLAEPHSQ